MTQKSNAKAGCTFLFCRFRIVRSGSPLGLQMHQQVGLLGDELLVTPTSMSATRDARKHISTAGC